MTELRTISDYRKAFRTGRLAAETLEYQSPVTVGFEMQLDELHQRITAKAVRLKSDKVKGKNVAGAEKTLEAEYALWQTGQEMLKEVKLAFQQMMREHNKEVERLERENYDVTKNFETLYTVYKGTANSEHILSRHLQKLIK